MTLVAVAASPSEGLPRGVREEMPNRVKCQTFKVNIGGTASIFLQCDEYPDGRVGAIFLEQSKIGSFTNGIMEAFSVAVSFLLQYGAPLHEIADRFIGMQFEPSGIAHEAALMTPTTSVVDWVFKTLTREYPNQ